MLSNEVIWKQETGPTLKLETKRASQWMRAGMEADLGWGERQEEPTVSLFLRPSSPTRSSPEDAMNEDRETNMFSFTRSWLPHISCHEQLNFRIQPFVLPVRSVLEEQNQHFIQLYTGVSIHQGCTDCHHGWRGTHLESLRPMERRPCSICLGGS